LDYFSTWRVFGLDGAEDASEETLCFEKFFRHLIVEGIKTDILCSITFFLNHAV